MYHCGFCQKGQNELKALVAGPNVYICSECVKIAINILNEECPEWDNAEDR